MRYLCSNRESRIEVELCRAGTSLLGNYRRRNAEVATVVIFVQSLVGVMWLVMVVMEVVVVKVVDGQGGDAKWTTTSGRSRHPIPSSFVLSTYLCKIYYYLTVSLVYGSSLRSLQSTVCKVPIPTLF